MQWWIRNILRAQQITPWENPVKEDKLLEKKRLSFSSEGTLIEGEMNLLPENFAFKLVSALKTEASGLGERMLWKSIQTEKNC